MERIEIRVVKSDGDYVFEETVSLSFDQFDFMIGRADVLDTEITKMVERVKASVRRNKSPIIK